MSDRRFDEAWTEFDARLSRGEHREQIVHDATERFLIMLLAARIGAGRMVDRNVVATELLNRSRHRSTDVNRLTAVTTSTIARAMQTWIETQRRVRDVRAGRVRGGPPAAAPGIAREAEGDGESHP